jgi:hypothetical protein
MDRIQDFLKELKARFSSPFFSSLILAWLIINWRVPIALIFYKLPELEKDEHSSYIDLIVKEVTVYSGIVYPIISAVCYTLIAPLLKNAIQALNAYLDAKGMDWTLTLSKRGKISVERYIQLRASYKAQEESLLKVYEDESKYLQMNNVLRGKMEEFRDKFENMNANYERLRACSEIRSYNGQWELTYADTNRDRKTSIVTLNEGDIYTTDREGKVLFKITKIGYSAQTTELMLVIEDRRGPSPKPFFVVLYCPNSERAIFINREPNQIIERMARPVFAGPEQE